MKARTLGLVLIAVALLTALFGYLRTGADPSAQSPSSEARASR